MTGRKKADGLRSIIMPYGRTEVPDSVLPLASRRISGLSAGLVDLTPRQALIAAYLQGIEDCYTALEHKGHIKDQARP